MGLLCIYIGENKVSLLLQVNVISHVLTRDVVPVWDAANVRKAGQVNVVRSQFVHCPVSTADSALLHVNASALAAGAVIDVAKVSCF